MNPLLGRGFTCDIKPYFLRKIKEKKKKVLPAVVLFGSLRIKSFHVKIYKELELSGTHVYFASHKK